MGLKHLIQRIGGSKPKPDHKSTKLTKAKIKEFVSLIKDCKTSDLGKMKGMIREWPELVDLTITGMAKGIDGFSSLMLAIRFYNYEFATVLVEAGANVNYIDSSPERYYHSPLFFDLIEMMKKSIESETRNLSRKKEWFSKAMQLWETLEENGLDYSVRAPKTEITIAENCLSAAIRWIGTEYANKHRVHQKSVYIPGEPSRTKYTLSEDSRDREKELFYQTILQKIVEKIPIEMVNEVDCRNHRANSLVDLSFYEQNGFVDSYSLETANELTRARFNRELPNYRGEKALRNVSETITRFAD